MTDLTGEKQTVHRRPIGNFFIKKELQVRLIIRIIAAVLVSTLICVLSLLAVYFLRYNSILLYQLNSEGDLTKENIVVILLPSLLISAVVNIVVGLLVGMYASRKYAVPIYKLEQWIMLLRNGKMTAKLRFREKEEMRDLSHHCNVLADDMRIRFQEIKKHVENAKKAAPQSADIAAIEQQLSTLELDAESIEVHTNFFQIPAGK